MIQFSGLPPELMNSIQRVLAAGETVQWAEQPAANRLLQRSGTDITVGVLFILVGLAVVLVGAAHSAWALAVVGFFGGLCGGSGFLWHALQAVQKGSKAIYCVTDRRVFTLAANGKLQNLSPPQIRERTVKRRANGSGDIYFQAWEKTVSSSDGDFTVRNGFLGVADVQAVEELLSRIEAADSF